MPLWQCHLLTKGRVLDWLWDWFGAWFFSQQKIIWESKGGRVVKIGPTIRHPWAIPIIYLFIYYFDPYCLPHLIPPTTKHTLSFFWRPLVHESHIECTSIMHYIYNDIMISHIHYYLNAIKDFFIFYFQVHCIFLLTFIYMLSVSHFSPLYHEFCH